VFSYKNLLNPVIDAYTSEWIYGFGSKWFELISLSILMDRIKN